MHILIILQTNSKVSHVKGEIYEFKTGGLHKPLNVLSKLYANATIYLERKHQKYNDLKEYVERRGKRR